MEKKHTDNLWKVRSSRACIADGYNLYMSNFRKIFRRSWHITLVYALIFSAFATMAVTQYSHIVVLNAALEAGFQINIGNPAEIYTFLGIFLLTALLYFAAATALASQGYQAQREHLETNEIAAAKKWYLPKFGLFGRTLKAVLWGFLTGFVFSAIIFLMFKVLGHFASPIVNTILVGVCSLLIGIFVFLPFIYLSTKYILTPKTHFATVFVKSYGTAIRNLGLIFIIFFIVTLITLILTAFTELPAHILYIANIQAQVGQFNGDPLGMPGYMMWLMPIVFALAGFIQGYVHLSMLFPLYYMFGTIDQKENERNENIQKL